LQTVTGISTSALATSVHGQLLQLQTVTGISTSISTYSFGPHHRSVLAQSTHTHTHTHISRHTVECWSSDFSVVRQEDGSTT